MNELLKSKKVVLVLMVISIIIVICLFLAMTKREAERFGLIKVSTSEPEKQDIENDNYNTNIEYASIRDVLESYGCIYNETIENEYYVKFPKDLFDEEGHANIVYFESLISSACKNLQLPTFVINDTDKDIRIKVTYNRSADTFIYSINNISGYFSNVDPTVYAQIADIPEVKVQYMPIKDELLKTLNEKNMMVINELGSGNAIGRQGDYSIFLDNTVKTRNYNGRTRNIIFYNNYPEEVFEEIKVGTSINTIKQKYPDYAFEGKDYVGYRTNDFYVFFYKDEISIYPYSSRSNSKLLDFIEEYNETKDIVKFEENVRTNYMNYDFYEFNKEEKSLKIHYPANGVMIDIKNNNTSGIVFYNNCFISEKLKKQVSEGKVKIELYQNSIEEAEKARINNE